MAAKYIRCPKCGFEGESVHYFKMHLFEVVIAAILTVFLYFIINVITNPQACPKCGNHRNLLPMERPGGTSAAA